MATFGGYNPVPYVLSQLTGSYQSVPDFLDSQHKIETRADAEAYVARLEAFARNVDLEVEHARADAGRGVVPPDFILDKALTQTRALRGRARRAGRAWSSRSSAATREKNIEGDWETQAAAIVDGRLAAALDRQIALADRAARAAPATNPAAGRLPDGERFYAHVPALPHLDRRSAPDEAHETGLRQIAELTRPGRAAAARARA